MGLLVLGAFSAGSVRAMDLLSFGFSDLVGIYDGSSLLSVADDGNSDGDVTRLVAPTGTAFMSGDSVSGFPGMAAFGISMTISAVDAMSAMGNGTITITDVDGDTLSGTLMGNWVNVNGSGNFVGQITNFMPVSDDGWFNGTDGSSFSMTFPVAPPFEGNIITLVFNRWFDEVGFQDATTQVIGAVIPEPATLALLALGGLLAVRRRQA